MSAISLKSITGITSITAPAGVDNQLTLHNNNTAERVKIDVAGNVHINNQLNVAGVVTATTFVGALTGTASGNPTLTNGANNRIVTATGANGLKGESNLTYESYLEATGGGAETWVMRAKSGGPSSKIGFQNQYLANGYTVGCGADNKSFVVYTNGQNSGERLRIDQTGITTFSQNVFANGTLNAGNIVQVGTTNDTGELRIGHDGSSYRARLVSNSSNSLEIDADGPERIQMHGGVIYMRPLNSEKSAAFVANGPAELYHDDIRTAFTDVDTWKVHGRTSNSGMVEIASNQGANNNDRFRIHKTSAASRLTIQAYSTGSWVENIRITAGGAVELKHSNGTTKFQTTGTGAQVTTASSANSVKNITTSTSTPSGGSDGDLWFTYVA